MEELKVLILDDEVDYANEVAEFLDNQNFDVFMAHLPSKAFKIIESEHIDLLILDIKLPEMDGISVLKKIKAEKPDIEVIMITGHGDMDTVIDSLRFGALDYINKPFGAFEIRSAIERSKRYISMSTEYKKLMKKYEAASKELKAKFGHEIIGTSKSIKSTISLMTKVAQTDDTSVLITGESGTGKELVARGIHQMSSRKGNYFCDVNCSAIPESLFESEFFGHVKGAFTGALGNKPGWFEFADKGTLFLDEIGDMPMHQQIKILRVLEQKRIRKVGSTKEVDVDVRIIAATNQDLKKLVQEKKFRLDLYHRLNTFSIHLDPLRERKDDILPLFEYFEKELSQKMRKFVSGREEKIIFNLLNYSFPGNIRELRNMIEKALIISDSTKLKLKDFSMEISENNEQNKKKYNLQLLEKNAILEVMKITRFKRKAAELLNITPQSLERRLEKLNIDENNS